MDLPPADTPVACDMSTATDTPEERLAEYHRLFEQALISRERPGDGAVRFRLRADEGIEAWVRDLAARELACCPFFAFEITTTADEVVWEAAVIDNDAARVVLDEFYALVDGATETVGDLPARFAERGLTITT
jgi:hypothetical protein